MSTLKRIRENVGLVIILIAISLFAFIFTDLFTNLGPGNDDSVAEVNGNSIPFPYLDEKVKFIERNAGEEFESLEDRYELQNRGWQSMIQEVVYNDEFGKLGITIPDEELKMMLTGRIYHPYVRSSGYFADTLTGEYNPGMVDLVLRTAEQYNIQDPRLPEGIRRWKQGLLDLFEILSLERRSNKWQRLVSGGMFVSDNEIQRSYNGDSRSVNISYVTVPYSAADSMALSEADYSEFYDSHKELFKRDEEASVKYTWFPKKPSKVDSAATRENINKLIADFKETTDPFQFAYSNSDLRSLDTLLKPVKLLPDALLPYLGRTDTVIGPVLEDNGYSLYRYAKVEEDTNVFSIKLRHIQLNFEGDGTAATALDSANTRQKARDLRVRLTSENFAQIAAEESKDFFTKDQGGEIGWLASVPLGEETPHFFQEALGDDLKDSQKGSFEIIETPRGVHIVEVMDRTNQLHAVAKITRTVTVSTVTSDSIYKRASKYLGAVIGGSDFDESLKEYPEAGTMTSPSFGPAEWKLQNVKGARPVIVWAFKNDAGFISEEVLEAEDAFVIARVETKGSKGYRPLDEVKQQIELLVQNNASGKQIASKLSSAGGGDLNAIASAYGPGATTGAAMDIRFNSRFVQGLNNEPKVIGRACGMQVGEVSQPIIGNNGVYVIKVDAINEAPAMPEPQRELKRTTLRSEKVSSAVNNSYQGLIDIAEIKDYRYNFDY